MTKSNTYSQLHIHLVFCTKFREPRIAPEIETVLKGYIIRIASKYNFMVPAVGCADDHVHLLMTLPPVLSVSEATKLIKGITSRWLNAIRILNILSAGSVDMQHLV